MNQGEGEQELTKRRRKPFPHGACLKERLVNCNEEDTDGDSARVTIDEERVLHRLNRDQTVG